MLFFILVFWSKALKYPVCKSTIPSLKLRVEILLICGVKAEFKLPNILLHQSSVQKKWCKHLGGVWEPFMPWKISNTLKDTKGRSGIKTSHHLMWQLLGYKARWGVTKATAFCESSLLVLDCKKKKQEGSLLCIDELLLLYQKITFQPTRWLLKF